AFAATGVRVGWAVGPADIMKPMSNIIGHMGAWAPRAEQVATAELLASTAEIKKYHDHFMTGIQQRLDALYHHVISMKKEGFPVAAIPPQGAIYLSVKFDVLGKRAGNTVLKTNDDIRKYLLDHAGFAVVPFQAFGLMQDTGWFRLSIGAVSVEDINAGMLRVRKALSELH
ncbi:MAG TPA: aminotransferase class I/II-fold pyridoxal phosphate-dependent enzyme, partial [Candidatus Kapabacteria bacterium]|nr:aminotransferase class I/II-fold pyridoxal phosphate-dependent enzyme [Candidatus Kapabacteria bacterium]